MIFHLKKTIMTIISVPIKLCVTISLGVHKTACLTDLFSGHSYCVETSHLICSAYRLIFSFLSFFFAVGMSTDRVFRACYAISFFVSLALSLSFITYVIDYF